MILLYALPKCKKTKGFYSDLILMLILMVNIGSQVGKILVDVKCFFKIPHNSQNISLVFSIEKRNHLRKKFLKFVKELSNLCQTKGKAKSIPRSLRGRMEMHGEARA